MDLIFRDDCPEIDRDHPVMDPLPTSRIERGMLRDPPTKKRMGEEISVLCFPHSPFSITGVSGSLPAESKDHQPLRSKVKKP